MANSTVEHNVPPLVAGQTESLLEAVKSGDIGLVRQLADAGEVQIEATTIEGQTPLQLATLHGHQDIVKVLLEHGANIETIDGQGKRPLFTAIQDGNLALANLLLQHNASPDSSTGGTSPLPLAVSNGRDELVKILIEHGAIADLPTLEGKTPLVIAVEAGNVTITKFLLDHGAEPDFATIEGPASALHRACSLGYIDIVRELLDHGADIDARDYHDDTPLFVAVAADSFQVTKLLLQRGANTRIRNQSGLTVIDVAAGKEEMLRLLRADTLLQGPRIKTRDADPGVHFEPLRLPPPPVGTQTDRVLACRGFEATIMQFFDDEGQERRTETFASVYELLYSKGPELLSSPSRNALMGGKSPNFTWYHLPANNMDWVEALMIRLLVEKKGTSAQFNNRVRSELGLLKSRRQQNKHSLMHLSSFKRPSCQIVSVHNKTFGVPLIIPHIPYLHYETFKGYTAMDKSLRSRGQISVAGVKPVGLRHVGLRPVGWRPPGGPPPPPPGWIGARTENFPKSFRFSTIRAGSPSSGSSSNEQQTSNGDRGTGRKGDASLMSKMGAILRNLRQIFTTYQVTSRDRTNSSASADDLECQTRVARAESRTEKERVSQNQPATQPTQEAARGRNTDISSPEKFPVAQTRQQPVQEPPQALSLLGSNKVPSASMHDTRLESGEKDVTMLSNPVPTEPHPPIRPFSQALPPHHGSRPTLKNPNQHLIHGYLLPAIMKEFGLQPRRTLDQYVYSHIKNISSRDDDQVIYRWTRAESLVPKMFMVDQLWLWILDADTIITCLPLRWQSWSARTSTAVPLHMPNSKLQPHTGQHTDPPLMSGSRPAEKAAQTHSHLAERVEAGQEAPQSKRMPSNPREQQDRPKLNQDDPLNVYQSVLKHLREQQSREALTSAFDLASLITTCCIGIFDQDKIPDEYHFLDFFELSIMKVFDEATSLLKKFKDSLKGEEAYWDIIKETGLVVEIEDILDELSTLHLVLTDQKKTVEKMNATFESAKYARANLDKDTVNDDKFSRIDTTILHSHFFQVEQAKASAEKAKNFLYHLIDLKQKHANSSEAILSRKQAQETTKQAIETARQGKTIMVFTVVTIIFLPLSFMAAFFAINTDVFPVNDAGKLPIDYVVRYTVGIGLALSVPFVFLAFNLDRVSSWMDVIRNFVSPYEARFRPYYMLLTLLLVILVVVWTSPMVTGVKVVLTSCFATLFLVLAIYRIWSALNLVAHPRPAATVTDDDSGSDGEMLWD